MPFAWTAIYLMNIVTGATGGQDADKSCETEPSRSASLGQFIHQQIIVLFPSYLGMAPYPFNQKKMFQDTTNGVLPLKA